jgi:hypothetical protein
VTGASKRGAVIEYPALFAFESYPRPYLVVSDDSHPFHGEEYIALAITTTEMPAAVALAADDWDRGGLPRQSYVKPWQPTLLKHGDVIDAFGMLRPAVIDRIVRDLVGYVGQ